MLSSRVDGVSFLTFTAKDIKNQSVKNITNPETFDEFLHPNAGGLYDRSMGPTDRSDLCESCGMNYVHCPGHLGHIELPLPVYHPIFFRILLQFLNLSCYNCHSLLISRSKEHLFLKQLIALDNGLSTIMHDLEEIFNSTVADSDYQKLSGDDQDDIVIEKLETFFSSLNFDELGKAESKSSKNTTKYRQILIKQFLGTTKVKACPRCLVPIRYFRAEYNSRLYLKPMSGSAAKKYANSKQATRLAAKDAKDVGEEEKNEDEPVEEEESEEKNDPEDIDNDLDIKKLLSQKYINPVEVRDHARLVFKRSRDLLRAVFGGSNTTDGADLDSIEMFFIDIIAVPPSRFRPLSCLGEKRFENPQTVNLNKILVDSKLIYKCLEETQNKDENAEDVGQTQVKLSKNKRNSAPVSVSGKTPAERLQNAWIKLQTDVNCYMDSDLDKLSLDKVPGIRQLLEKKEGLFRKHMMGKRVNYAARSVISPDPYLNTDEIGIPEIFAKKLTYAQPVTPWNCQQLRRAVVNGPNVHPGAVMIENEDGRKVILSASNQTQREAIAKRLLTPSTNETPILGCKKVYRHLINGDVLLLNRQPTLHRPSIMAHKARVLPNERTIRLHYANCKAYNADFDGDEMNAHFPQNELGRSEAYNLVSTNFQYLSPKDGKPLSGLIQDHVVSGVSLTSRGVLVNREDYHQLIFGALTNKPGKVETLSPCILKPEALWSGKQVLSTILINIIPEKSRLNLDSKAKVNDANWPKRSKRDTPLHQVAAKDPFLNEIFVIVRSGEVLTGILDKNQYGSSQFGLVHCVYELYGGQTSGQLLSALARLFTIYLRLRGFSLGVEDILVTPKANSKREKLIDAGRQCGNQAAASALGLPVECDSEELTERLQKAQHSNKGIDLKQLDLAMKKQTDHYQNKINSACVPHGLCRQFPDNSLQLMVQSGAKGSSVNCMQISSLLGQIELEGRRPPLMLSGRSLPSFVAYDTSPRAGGFVDGRFLTGIRPQEYFFHCMAGREGLVDTAVKTSRSGYLQRCLIKHLEGLMVQYDLSVRDSDGSVVQFLYGDDGIDVLKAQFLEEKQFPFIARNYTSYLRQLKPHRAMNALEQEEGNKREKKIKKWKSKHGSPTSSRFFHDKVSPYLLFEKDHKEETHNKDVGDKELIDSWRKLGHQAKQKYESKCQPCPDPVISVLSPDRHFASVSETFLSRVYEYVSLNPDSLLSKERDRSAIRNDQFLPLMMFKYSRSLAEPGEAVGLLAGQSIGEPSTQMTLNTFHFAGRGEMNVTLGIPRLREILMTASSNIKTPTMDVLVKEGSNPLKKAEKLQKKLNRVTLADVIQKIEVFESLSTGESAGLHKRLRQFKVRMEFLHRRIYKDDYSVTPKHILTYVERTFIRRMIFAVRKLMNIKLADRVVKSLEEGSVSPTNTNFAVEDENDDAMMAEDEKDDDADLSDEELAGDGDAADSKSKSRQMQFTSYDEPDEDEAMKDDSDSEEEDSSKQIKNSNESFLEDADTLDDQANASCEDVDNNEQDLRISGVLAINDVVNYTYDIKKNLWCEITAKFSMSGTKVMLLSLIEKLAEKAVVNEASGIKRAFLSTSDAKGEEGRHRIKTEGVNILELWQHPKVLELNSLYTNDVHAIARTYGIEAARQVIIKEITNVFKVYGIQIDPRHLSLVADYMTFEGTYKPFNRQGIESNPFPLQKMTFETTTHFLREASAFGRVDTLDSPSSRLVVGRVIKSGTGIFELRQPLRW